MGACASRAECERSVGTTTGAATWATGPRPSPRSSVSWRRPSRSAPGWSWPAQLARGFRAPLLSDRYYRGVTGRGFITGNPDLEARPATSATLPCAPPAGGCRWRGLPISTASTTWWSATGTGPTTSSATVGSPRSAAWSEELGAAWGAGFELQLGAQALRGEVGRRSALDDIPALGGFAVLRGHLGEPGWWLLRLAVKGRDQQPESHRVRGPGSRGGGCRLRLESGPWSRG